MFSCYLIGSESLLIQCAESLLANGHEIRGIISDARQIRDWATANAIKAIEPSEQYAPLFADEPFDYLLSITNFSIIPDKVLELPIHGTINFHDGPLPAYSGLNVTTWALSEGQTTHAISWHIAEAGIDTGDIIVEKEIDIALDETAFSLNTKCFEAAITTFPLLIKSLESRSLLGRSQNSDSGKYFGKYHRPRHDGVIDFRERADELVRLIRSLDFGTYDNTVGTAKFILGDMLVVVGGAQLGTTSTKPAGTITRCTKNELQVATQTDDIILSRLRVVLDSGRIGTPDLTTRLFVGDLIPALSAALTADLDRYAEHTARNDVLALAVLVDPKPATISSGFVTDDDSGFETCEFEPATVTIDGSLSTASVSAATLATFLSKYCNQRDVDLKIFSHRDLSDSGLGVIYRDGAPLRLSFADVAEPIGNTVERIAKRLGRYEAFAKISADLSDRYRSLPTADSLETVEVHFAETAQNPGSTAGLAATIDGSGTMWLVSRKSTVGTETFQNFQKQFAQFSTYAARRPDAAFNETGLLATDEYDKIIREWNQTATSYERTTIPEQFKAAVALNADSIALVTDRERLTYAELDGRSGQLANRLIKRGVKTGDRVGLCTDRSASMMIGVMAILKAGAAYVPLDPDFPRDRLRYIAGDAQVADLICLRKYAGLFSDYAAQTLVLEQSDWTSESTSVPDVTVTGDDLAYVIHTSGSTGTPKGVMVRHRNVANFFVAMDRVLGPKGGTWLAVTSLSFDISVLELLWTLTRGFKVVLGSPVKPARETTVLENQNIPVEFSLFFFAASSAQVQGQRDQYRLLLESARYADEHGFVAIWSPERHFHSFGGLYPNPAVTNAALATITKNVRLRAGSLVAPLHHPIRMAEEWSMVDNLSGGRVDAAFAAGWQPNDFVLQPQNFEDRKNIMFGQIETIQKLWAGEKVDFVKADGKTISVSTLPRPVQKTFPVWITAAGNPETFALAGSKGYNILTHLLGQSTDELAEKIRVYREAEKAGGHSGGTVTLMLHTFIGDSVDSVREIVREPMKAYLSTAMNLVKEAAWSFPTFKEMTITDEGRFSMEHLSGDDQTAILDFAFDRYFEGGGLFGSVESCAPFVDKLKGVGVNEIGCLIDYGVDVDLALSALPELARLLKESNPTAVTHTASFGDGMPSAVAPFVAGRTDAEEAVDLSMYGLALREGVTHMQCTPSMARMLVADEEGQQVLGKLEQFLVGGEALDSDLGRDILTHTNASLTNMYGPTETTVWSTSWSVTGDEDAMPIGRPIANNTVYVLGRDGSPVPQGSVGELFIGGDGVTAGYLNRPDLTDERFVPDPYSQRSGTMYRTGDLCRFRPDGILEFLGRNDQQVKVRGYRIELGEIEKALRTDKSVSEVAVAVEKLAGDPIIVAYLIEHSDGAFSKDLARTELEKSLPPYMVPSQFNVLSSFPRTPNGKLDRNALAKQKPKATTKTLVHTETIAPGSDLEQTIADTWKTVLDLDSIGVTDNFFDIGGHSLLAVQVNAKLSSALGESLSLIDIFRFPTVRSFAEHLKGRQSGQPSEAVTKGSSRAEARRAAMNRRSR